jgi:hypothetical protein
MFGGSSGYSGSSASQQSNSYSPQKYTPWAPYVNYTNDRTRHGFNPDQAVGLYDKPQGMIPHSAPHANPLGAEYSTLGALPATPLAFLEAGAKKSFGAHPTEFASALDKFYGQAAGPGKLPQPQALLHTLASPPKGGALDESFRIQSAPEQAATYAPYIQAITTLMPDLKGAAVAAYADYLSNQYVSKNLRSKAPQRIVSYNKAGVPSYSYKGGMHGPTLNRWVTRRVMR